MIKLLVEAGFVINLAKCKFLVRTVKAVGHLVTAGHYVVGDKTMAALLKARIPRTLNQLQ